MLETGNTALVLVDLQEKLLRVMHEREALLDSVVRLVKGAAVLGVPVIYTEQNPRGLGPTVAAVGDLLPDPPITKLAFSCCGEPAFTDALARLGRRQVLLAGIETHVCVYQTAADLIAAAWEVQVVTDAVSSRSEANKAVGLENAAGRRGGHQRGNRPVRTPQGRRRPPIQGPTGDRQVD